MIKFGYFGDTSFLQEMLKGGISGFSIDHLVPAGKSAIWLFLNNSETLKITSRMVELDGWNEIGVLEFAIGKFFPHSKNISVPKQWRDLKRVDKLVFERGGFSAESGIIFGNVLDEELIITPSRNVYNLEIKAPFYSGEFFPENEISKYKRISLS